MKKSGGVWQRWLRGAVSLKAKRQIHEMYLFTLFFSFAWSLIILFEPILLYKQGFDLSLIALYYALHYTLYILLMPLGAKFAARFSYERSLAVSTPLLVMYALLLAALSYGQWIYWPALVVLTLHKIFYWPASYAIFAQYGNAHNRGTEQSWQRFIIYGVGVLGPLIGGFVAKWLGFSALFILAAATLTIASVFILRTKEREQHVQITYRSVWKIILSHKERRMAIATLGWAGNLVHMVFWPIVLFLIMGGAAAVGIVTAISTIIMTLWGFVVGEWSDRTSPCRVLKWSALIESASYLLRGAILLPMPALIADGVGRVGNATMEIPFMAQIYGRAKETEPLTYSTAFETVLASSKAILAWSLVVVFAIYSPSIGFMTAFGLAALLSLLYAVF